MKPRASLDLLSRLAWSDIFRAHGAAATPADSEPPAQPEGQKLWVIIRSDYEKALSKTLEGVGASGLHALGGGFFTTRLSPLGAKGILGAEQVRRIYTPTRSEPHLIEVLPLIGLLGGRGGTRTIEETGRGVLVGIVDSGFDLSHPAFRDANQRLRVEGLYDQTGEDDAFYTAEQLETARQGKTGPGFDPDGHGTHVASIAAGTCFLGHEGVAPEARFLLVKTDFERTMAAVDWIFRQAGNRPCVVNLSLGWHLGAHDGSDKEECWHAQKVGPGKIIVASAGNERRQNVHLGGWFHPESTEEVLFDINCPTGGEPRLDLTAWYPPEDSFEGELVAPDGQSLAWPDLGTDMSCPWPRTLLYMARAVDPDSGAVELLIRLRLPLATLRDSDLYGWKLRIRCKRAAFGRFDAWLGLARQGKFRSHPLVDEFRTVALPATGPAAIAVASHVCRCQWQSDGGQMSDLRAVPGRASWFSSLGPTRDGRLKPEISAPGEYVTAALAGDSRCARWAERAQVAQQLLTLEGTSMAAPVVTGAVALILQKRPMTTVERIREILAETAVRDAYVDWRQWNPAYGHGKLDVRAIIKKI